MASKRRSDSSARRVPSWCSASLALCVALGGAGCSGDDDDEAAEPETVRAALTPDETSNLAVAKRVLTEGLIGGDTAVINELVREDYIQHNAQASDGRAGLLAFVAFLQTQPGSAVTFHRELANGDLVALHSTYGTGAGRTVAFDVFRLVGGQLAEHWDALQPWVDASESASGNTLVDGETTVTDRARTERNQTLVTNMVREVFVEGQVGRIPVYIDPNTYVQHNPRAENGLQGLIQFFLSAQQQGIQIGYTSSPLVVADGNFVLVGSEGYFGTRDDYAIFYDLFRVANERIVEHWDVIPPAIDVDAIPHDNGLF
jgi:predicted SnoaL-like aldol condensation-catalyzing enzyme